jgi:ubiquitin C
MKTKIADKTGIDIEKFKLKLNGKDLSDESLTISEAKITKDSVLKIVLKKITLVVTTNDNKVITITIAVSEKISHLKGIISQKGGIAMDRFFLRLGNGVELIETKTLEESGIHSYSSLMIIYYKVQVTITIYKPGFQPPIVVTLDIMDTIADLKDRIKEKDALDSSKYVLKSGQEELDDGKTMDSIIKEQKSIRIVFKSILLTVNGKNKVFTMTVFWADTISKIKERIHKLDQTPIDRTQLKFGGVVLKGSKTVEECGLKDGSALKLVYTTMKLHYQMHDDPEGAK